jgi:hypothetical protein
MPVTLSCTVVMVRRDIILPIDNMASTVILESWYMGRIADKKRNVAVATATPLQNNLIRVEDNG